MSLQQVGVLFDMDGVLVDSNPYHKIALQEFCKRHQKFLSEEELIQKVYGRTNKDWITNLFGNISQETLTQYANEKEALFREIYAPHVKPVDGLTDFLNELIENKIPFTISTSAPSENVAFTLKAIALENVFPIILDERFVNKGKPDPEIYIKSAAAIQLPTSQCWVIEDSISGIQAGKSAGCKVIGITTTHLANEMPLADFIIQDFKQLKLNQLMNME